MSPLIWQMPIFAASVVLTLWILGLGLLAAFHPKAKALPGNIWLGLGLLVLTVIQPVLYGWIK